MGDLNKDFLAELDEVIGTGPVIVDDPKPVSEPIPDPDYEEPTELAPEPEPIIEPEPEPEPEPIVEPEPIIEPKSEDEPEDEVASLKNQNELLLRRLDALEGKSKDVVKEPDDPGEKPDEKKPISFLTDDDDIDEILSKKEKLNEFALRIYQKAIDDASSSTRESVFRSIPQVVVQQVQQQMVLREGINEFFKENKDLIPARKTVGAFANEVVAEHPEWTLKEVFVEAEKKTREALGIKKRALKEVAKSEGDRNPALVGKIKGNKAKDSDRRSGLQTEIDDIINI
uniref:Uncharacterized protein n=1 Tax=viral metagenome TaxID=1070528 RepID=A0A6M3K7Q6_9ZZZZ